MNKLKTKLQNITSQQFTNVYIVTIILLIALDIDQYLYPVLNQYGIPLPSTIFHFIWLPLYVLAIFFILEPNKKKVFICAFSIGVIYAGYLVIHHFNVLNLRDSLMLPANFYYNIRDELINLITLIIPFGYIYAVYRLNISVKNVEKILLIVSMMISVPIVITNIFTCSPSTYEGWTKANFLTWFSNIYEVYHPRQIATKFFFSQGNTTGIVLFMTYPVLWNMLYKAKCNWKLIVAIIIQGLAMYCLATRVATYGVLLLPVAYLLIWLFCIVFKKAVFDKKFLLITLVILAVFGSMFKYTPAYVNQQINNQNDWELVSKDDLRLQIKDGIIADGSLVPGSQEYINFWSYIFWDNKWLLSIPKVYYMEFYHYGLDPKFWVDLIFEYDFYDRASGRDFEKIFFDYKWANITPQQKLLGFGYSTFMNGSIVLEQDFIMQIYTLGPVGFALFVSPWLILLLIVLVLALKRFKHVLSTDILVFGMSLVGGYFCAYSSGHALDELFSSMLLALLMGKLLLMVTKPQLVNTNE